MRQGDHANAVLVLNRALKLEPQNISIGKDLALSYYFQQENAKALDIINPILERDEADDQAFQIAGMIYKRTDQKKEAEKMYKRALKKFPESGPLYNELGELQWEQQNFDAIRLWEKGIAADPSYAKNYYNAARFYYLTTDKVWSILYAEIFINMEPLSNRAPEMKQLLVDAYKKFYMQVSADAIAKEKNSFVKKVAANLEAQAPLTSMGIGTESLSMIRTRFIIDWFEDEKTPSFKLFSYHQQLLREGLFEAYNQWLFGSTQNLSAYQSWVNNHTDENAAFLQFQQSWVFKIPEKEYYH